MKVDVETYRSCEVFLCKIINMKLTKRKGFNFFRSYYDVYNELSDKDKVLFMDALLDRQFLGVKPNIPKGMANFAYLSQTNSIDSQVKGYEDKTKTKLLITPTDGGADGGVDTPTLQVQVQEKEKEQYNIPTKVDGFDFDKLLIFINNSFKRNYKTINKSVQQKYKARLKDGYTKEDVENAIRNCIDDKHHADNNYKYCTPDYFSRANTLDLHCEVTKVVDPLVEQAKLINERYESNR